MWLIKVLLVGLLVFFLVPGVNAQEWWNINYTNRQQINATNFNTSSLVAGYTINLTFDHFNLVSTGASEENGNDVRVVVNHSREIDRMLCFGSFWNQTDTCIEFKLESLLLNQSSNLSYWIYYRNVTPINPAPENGSNIYLIYDDFSGNQFNHPWFNATSGVCTHSIGDNEFRAVGLRTNENCRVWSPIGENLSAWRAQSEFKFQRFTAESNAQFIGISDANNTGWFDTQNFTFLHVRADGLGYSTFTRLIGGSTPDNSFVASTDNVRANYTLAVFNNIQLVQINDTINISFDNDVVFGEYFYMLNERSSGAANDIGHVNFTEVRFMHFHIQQPVLTLGEVQGSAAFDNCEVFDVLALNFTVYDEQNRTDTVPSDWEATFIFQDSFGNFFNNSIIATNSINLSICLASNTSVLANATIQYENNTAVAKDYSRRFYILQNSTIDNVTDDIALFLLEESLSAQITFIVINPYNLPLANYIVKATRFFIGEGDYIQVAMGLSDFDGEATTQLKLNEWYIFIVERDGVIIRTFPQKFVIDTADITLNTQPGTQVEYFEYYDSLGASCTPNQAASLITCIFSDTSGKMVELNLTVTRQQLVGGFISICTNTTIASSGTITCSYAGYNTTDLVYTLRGRFCCSETTFFNLLTGMIIGITAAPFGVIGVIAMIFILMASILFGYWNPVIPIVMGLFGIMIGMMLQLIVVSGVSFMSLVIAGGILIWKMRT